MDNLNKLNHIRTMCDSAELFFVFLMPNGQSRFRGCATILLADTQWGQSHFTFEFLKMQFHEHCGKKMIEEEIIHWTQTK